MKEIIHCYDEKLSIYHIQYINEIVNIQKKTNGLLCSLLGITSCLNNPILFLRKVFKKQLVYLQKQQLKGESIG
jgi:hypothetical protein